MVDFSVKRPKNYPLRCNLLDTEKEALTRAEKKPTLSSLEKIARALNVSLSELLALPDDKAILDADVQVLNKAIEILKQALEQAKKYKESRQGFNSLFFFAGSSVYLSLFNLRIMRSVLSTGLVQ